MYFLWLEISPTRNLTIQFPGTFYIVTKNHTDVIPPVISKIQTYLWNSTFCQFLIIVKRFNKCSQGMFLNFCTTVISEGFCQSGVTWSDILISLFIFTFQGNYGLKIVTIKSTGKFDKLKLLGKGMDGSLRDRNKYFSIGLYSVVKTILLIRCYLENI